ncbi:uncharacterized protein LOC142229884 [Haematobia irritans]|uniref:uncharacterized protein LOC142229884 n=1 Tax=Haematobia irritans TaxID=7368 RepID=UPI003F50ABF6
MEKIVQYNSNIKRQTPDFIQCHIAFADCLTITANNKTCLVLTKNLKFLEFYQKQLMASIDLSKTCINKVGTKCSTAADIGECDSEASSYSPKIYFGKYILHAVTVTKIYIIIHCLDKCVILLRLPDFKGFEIKEEYEEVREFRIINGSLKYSAILEIEFENDTVIKVDFEEGCTEQSDQLDFVEKKAELKLLLDRVRSAKTELKLHEGLTAIGFQNLQKRLTYGLPNARPVKLEEKQMLARCGDVWQRLTPHNDLVIGVPLVNQCTHPNITILQNIQPLLEVPSIPGSAIFIEYRLFQLKHGFDTLDSVETFLQTEDEEIQMNVWTDDAKCRLLPESYVILVMKVKISDIMSLKESPLLLNYEISQENCLTKLQIYLHTIDVHKILFEQRPKYELRFQEWTLHQDFLTIAISSHETCLGIILKQEGDLDIFEFCLRQKFEFEKLPPFTENQINNCMYYNHRRVSLWFGCLILRSCKVEENDNDHSVTRWKIYCPDAEKTFLFTKMLLHDLTTLQCNVVSIENRNRSILNGAQSVMELENSLREELYRTNKLIKENTCEGACEKWLQMSTHVFKAQLQTDLIYKRIGQ